MKSPKNRTKNQDSTQPLLFDMNIVDAHRGKFSRSEANTPPPKEAVKAQKPKPFNQSVHLLPWGEEALGL